LTTLPIGSIITIEVIVMGKQRYIHFPLRLAPELHDLLHRAAFATGKSKHQYCIDAIRKEAERDAQDVQIQTVPKQGAKEEAE
jgi:uncharacterized protein (DUF1778 family)